jgi:hypothetical protein
VFVSVSNAAVKIRSARSLKLRCVPQAGRPKIENVEYHY